MNKMNFVATAVALSALCLAGCSNDAEQPGTEPQPGRQVMMTMQASTAEPQTRADYTEDGDNNMMRFSWRKNDAISVLVDGYGPDASNLNCRLTATDAGKSVTFSGKAEAWDGERNIYAGYPYKQSVPGGYGYLIYTPETPSTASTSLTLANPQEFTVGGAFTNGFLVGAGTATTEGSQINVSPVSMKQVMSFVRFNITEAPGNVTKVTMAGQKLNTDYPNNVFPTRALVFMSTGERKQDGGTGGYKTELTMNVTDDTGPGNKSVSFALWPGDYRDVEITITITFEGGKVITLPTKQGMKFERNVHYVVDVDAGVYIWDGSSTAKPADYTGNPGKVNITSAAELAWLAQECNDGNKFENYTFNLTTDIDLDNHEWTPIGNFDNRFYGNFNGQGHTVRNMEVDIKVDTDFYAGFIGFMEGVDGNLLKVSNLIVEGNVNAAFTNGAGHPGGICGFASFVKFEFCRFNGTVSGTGTRSTRCGGIVGAYRGNSIQSLTCCISDAEVTVSGESTSNGRGGLIGNLINGSVTYSAWNSSRTAEGVGRIASGTFDEALNNSFTDITGLNKLLDDINNSKPESDYKWKAGDNTNTASPILVKRTPSDIN